MLKKIASYGFAVMGTWLISATNANAVIFFNETFETDGNGTRYTTSVPEFTNDSTDYFTRTDGSNISAGVEFTNITGSYFAAQDIDGGSSSSQQSITWSGIDISGFENLELTASIAEDDDGTNQDWDDSDFVNFSATFDGGSSTNVLAFENDGSTFNSAAFEDTDFDGIGDGTEVTNEFTDFTKSLTNTGSTLDLVITMDLNAGDEDIAIDNIRISGDTTATAAVPFEFSPTLGLLFVGTIIGYKKLRTRAKSF